MNVYELSRNYWDYAFRNPDKIKPNHSAMYFFAIEHCNRLGWKEKFGFPTTIVMEAIGIKSYNTFINTLKELVEFGFIEMIEKSKNQYSANIIALSIFDKASDNAHDKALDEALIKHSSKQSESTEQSIDSIDKQTYNTTNIPINNNEAEASDKIFPEIKSEDFSNEVIPKIKDKEKSSAKKESKVKIFFFKQAMIEYGFNKDLVDHFIEVRKKKRLVNTEVAFKNFIREIEKTGKDKNEVFEIITNKQWGGFEAKWLNNVDQINLKSALSKPGKNVHIA